MPFTLTMPKLSPTMEEGTIVAWHKKEGDKVSADELLLEAATDKATVEYNSLEEGFLRQILIKEGAGARVGQAIAIFTLKADESIDGYQPEGIAIKAAAVAVELSPEEKVEAKATVTAAFSQPVFLPEPPPEHYRFEALRSKDRIKASPLAKKIAQEKGLDLGSVKGSGPGGRVTSEDLGMAQKAGPVHFGAGAIPEGVPGSFVHLPLTPMRKVIGQRLQESKTFIPHFYVNQAVNVDALVEARTQLKSWGLNVSVNDFVVRACALALRTHPVINSAYGQDAIIHYETIDICVAVSVDGGLLTPIIRHADFKDIGHISAEVKELAMRARSGKLAPEEYKGGSFTISNLGMYGISFFTAVINPPQGAILAVGGIEEMPVIRNGTVLPGKVMQMTLSSDHRVIDGAAAAEFMKTVQKYLEAPAGLLLSS